jgi:putative ABC transport system substrate-binding protein
MKRRAFITLLGGAAGWPFAVRAQQQTLPVIGFLDSGAAEFNPDRLAAFRRGLAEVGFVEGKNVAVEFRWAQGQYNQLPALVAELVRRPVAVIFAATLQAALPAKAATSTTPIVFAIGSDPVAYGLVGSFNRPGGNITGMSWLGGFTMPAKRLQLLHEATPAATAIGVLINPTNPSAETEVKVLKETASALVARFNQFEEAR